MLDDPPEVFAACLKTLGYSLNSADLGELRAAQQRAIAQKPLVRAYLNAEVRDQLVAGDVAAAQAWAVTAAQAIAAAPEKLAFVFPAEGFPRYADNVAILRESTRMEAARRADLDASQRGVDRGSSQERGARLCPQGRPAEGTARAVVRLRIDTAARARIRWRNDCRAARRARDGHRGLR